MARTARVVVPGLPHHVYLRGNNRRRLFSRVSDRVRWCACLSRALDATGCALHQLTLMTNHIHMIVTPTSREALPAMVKRACQRYAQVRNALRDASGKLFEERYGSKVIDDDEHLRTATLYNDANAFRAGLVADPLEHEWSTAPLHAGRDGSRVARLWTPSAWYLGLGATTDARAAAYAALMSAYARSPRSDADDIGKPECVVAYGLRLERPDGTCAREVPLRYG
jgi:putative transposase